MKRQIHVIKINVKIFLIMSSTDTIYDVCESGQYISSPSHMVLAISKEWWIS